MKEHRTELTKVETKGGFFLNFFGELDADGSGSDYEYAWVKDFFRKVCEMHGLDYNELTRGDTWWAIGVATDEESLPPHRFENSTLVLLKEDE
jgi:hypothetical protein